MVSTAFLDAGDLVELEHAETGVFHSPAALIRGILILCLTLAMVGLVAPTSAAASSYDPGPVENVSVVPGPGSLTVSWSPPSDPGLAFTGGGAYMRYYQVSTTSYGSGNDGCTLVFDTTCTLGGLTNGQSYTVYIKSCNSNNSDTYCLWYTRYFAGSFTPCCSVPSAPRSVAASAGDGVATVSWTAPTDNPAAVGPITGYAVASNPPSQLCQTVERTCQVTGLQNGVTYQFAVVALNSTGRSPLSVASNAVMPAGLPSQPQTVSALLSKGSAIVSWVGPASTGGVPVTQYTAVSTPGGLVCSTSGAVSCVVKGLSNGQTYTFTVTAVNRVGSSEASAASPPAKLLAGPGKPLAVKAARSGTTGRVTWKPPRSTGGAKITKYVVTASPSGRKCTTKKLTCTFSRLRVGNTYSFSVQPFNVKGPGIPVESNKIRVPIPPPPPPPPKQDQEIS